MNNVADVDDQDDSFAIEMQREGVIEHDNPGAQLGLQEKNLQINDNYNHHDHDHRISSSFDTSNWQDWTAEKVNEYIEYLLTESNYHKKDIDNLMNQVLLKMNITGKVLKTLKEDEELWIQFQNKIENHSFGIWIAISASLKKLQL